MIANKRIWDGKRHYKKDSGVFIGDAIIILFYDYKSVLKRARLAVVEQGLI